MKCPNCGLNSGFHYCIHCGKDMPLSLVPEPAPSSGGVRRSTKGEGMSLTERAALVPQHIYARVTLMLGQITLKIECGNLTIDELLALRMLKTAIKELQELHFPHETQQIPEGRECRACAALTTLCDQWEMRMRPLADSITAENAKESARTTVPSGEWTREEAVEMHRRKAEQLATLAAERDAANEKLRAIAAPAVSGVLARMAAPQAEVIEAMRNNLAVLDRVKAERDALKAGICTGCGLTRLAAIEAVVSGKAACCPDCSTLSVEERNAIRAVTAERDRYKRAQQQDKRLLNEAVALLATVTAERDRAELSKAAEYEAHRMTQCERDALKAAQLTEEEVDRVWGVHSQPLEKTWVMDVQMVNACISAARGKEQP